MESIDHQDPTTNQQKNTIWNWNLSDDYIIKKPSQIGSQHKDQQSSHLEFNFTNQYLCNQHNLSIQERSLALENINSLALLMRHSMEKGIPIPKVMLSNSSDPFQPQQEQYHQNDQLNQVSKDQEKIFPSQFSNSKQPINPKIKCLKYKIKQLHSQDAKLLVDSLGLESLIPIKKDNTKNVLRNFGNAQNQFILYHKDARLIIEQQLHDPTKFDSWVRTLKLQNFEHFKKVWQQGSLRPYIRLYKRLCWKFYTQQAIPYVLSSRMKNSQTKISHLKYIYRFLQGIKDPQNFNYFKKQEK